jgi:CRISPR/Cas system Type II protein with McrA/HNH and RuvC-like nuclease domain
LEESQLEVFLFGADRTLTARIRTGLWEVQDCRCFYCGSRIRQPGDGQVDHFVPWSRYPDDALDNLVVADRTCNGSKSSSLAATDHLLRWSRRFASHSSEFTQLAELAQRTSWDRHAERSLSVARAIYLRLPDDARLWVRGKEFVSPDLAAIGAALA